MSAPDFLDTWRFSQDLESLHQRFHALLANFAARLMTERSKEVFGNELLLQIRQHELQVESQLKRDFLLVVMGNFKRGKSTLVNALIGDSVATTDVLPETVTINEIRFGAERRADAYLKGGKRLAVEVDHLGSERLVPLLVRHLSEGAGDAAPESLNRKVAAMKFKLRKWLLDCYSEEEFKYLLAELDVPRGAIGGDSLEGRMLEFIEHEWRHGRIQRLIEKCTEQRPLRAMDNEILLFMSAPPPAVAAPTVPQPPPLSRRLARLEQVQESVERLIVQAPIEWLRGIALVDTPGTGDVLDRFDAQVRNYIQKADAVIYVTSAQAPLAESERNFLRTAIPLHDFPKILFVVNRLDELGSVRNITRVLDKVSAQVHTLFPGAPVFGLSALQEWCDLQGQPELRVELTGLLRTAFRSFRVCLQESILLNRDLIQMDRAIASSERLVSQFDACARRIKAATGSSQSTLASEIANYEDAGATSRWTAPDGFESFNAEFAELTDEICQWMAEFAARLPVEMAPSLAHVEVEDIERSFSYYFSDLMRSALHRCLEAHRPRILELVNRNVMAMVSELSTDTPAGNTLSQSSLLRFNSDLEAAWTNLDRYGAMVDSSLATVAAVTRKALASMGDIPPRPTFASAESRRHLYQEKLRTTSPLLAELVCTELRTLYANMAQSLQNEIIRAGEQTVQTELTALRRAHALNNSIQAAENNIGDALDEILAVTSETQEMLQQLREQLWASEERAV